jgi:uncharacterized protein (TIGR03118 family)
MYRFSSRLALVLLMFVPLARAQYQVTNLVSDGSVPANHPDANLVNPWGLVHSPSGPFVVADNGTGVATAYNSNGVAVPKNQRLIVTIPGAARTAGNPSGAVYNPTNRFRIGDANAQLPAQFIFVSEDGTISGYNRRLNPTMALIAHQDSDAIYKGAALALGATPLLFATNFHDNAVEIYDDNFDEAGSFTDPNLPPHTAPFGIRAFNGLLYVTFAVQDADAEDDVAGPGHGALDVFTPNGQLVKRLVTRGPLNSPWGLAMAPHDFGEFSGALLVGNFGNGRINAFDPDDGSFLGALRDVNGDPLVIDGLWALDFGDGKPGGGPTNVLFFTAGPNDETDGLFGKITVVD